MGCTKASEEELKAFNAEASARLEGPVWFSQMRADALKHFEAEGLPTEAEEIWRYSRIDDLNLDSFAPVHGSGDMPYSLAGLPDWVNAAVNDIGPLAASAVCIDGAIVSVKLSEAAAAAGVIITNALEHPQGSDLAAFMAQMPDSIVALGTAFATDVLAVVIPAGVVLVEPIAIVHWTSADPVDGRQPASFPRTTVGLGEGSIASVVELSASKGDSVALVAPVTHLAVSDNADLNFLSVQLLGEHVWQLAFDSHAVGTDAHLRSFAIALGGDYARLRTDSSLVGKGGISELLAAYFGRSHQVLDFRTNQEHVAPKTTSDLLFKGAVADDARSVYTGMIQVRRGAHGTSAFQTNRNLVLSPGAHADSVPNLDISENDVRCSHASAVGPVDQDQMYYLATRGIPGAVAERLIVLGFFDDILEKLPVGGLRALLKSAIAERLSKVQLKDDESFSAASGDRDHETKTQ